VDNTYDSSYETTRGPGGPISLVRLAYSWLF